MVEMEVSMAMGIPKIGWFIRDNANLKWMITRGTLILGNPHIDKSMLKLEDPMYYGSPEHS